MADGMEPGQAECFISLTVVNELLGIEDGMGELCPGGFVVEEVWCGGEVAGGGSPLF
jgi:hypothetical protein